MESLHTLPSLNSDCENNLDVNVDILSSPLLPLSLSMPPVSFLVSPLLFERDLSPLSDVSDAIVDVPGVTQHG